MFGWFLCGLKGEYYMCLGFILMFVNYLCFKVLCVVIFLFGFRWVILVIMFINLRLMWFFSLGKGFWRLKVVFLMSLLRGLYYWLGLFLICLSSFINVFVFLKWLNYILSLVSCFCVGILLVSLFNVVSFFCGNLVLVYLRLRLLSIKLIDVRLNENMLDGLVWWFWI